MSYENYNERLEESVDAYLDGDVIGAINLVSNEKFEQTNDEDELYDIRHKLAHIYYNSYIEDDALIVYEDLIEYSINKYGELHEKTLMYRQNKAACLYAENTQEDIQQALEHFIYIYKKRVETLGLKDTNTLSALNWIGTCYDALSQYKKAMYVYQKAFDFRCQTLGNKHDLTLNTLAHIAHSTYNMGQRRKAFELFKQAYALRSEVSGKTDERALALKNWIASCHYKFEEYAQAKSVFQDIIADTEHEDIKPEDYYTAKAWIEKIDDILFKKNKKWNPQKKY